MNNQDYKAMYYINKMVENDEVNDYDLTNWCRKAKFIIHKDKDEDKKGICQVIKTKIKELANKYDKTQKTMEEKNIDTLAKIFKLSEIEKEILSVLYLPHNNRLFKDFKGQIQHYSSGIAVRVLGAMLDKFIIKYVGRSSLLAKLGFINPESCDIRLTLYFVDLISNKQKTEKDFINTLLGKNLTTELTAKDFKYISELDFALKIMKSSAKNGINILLYGNPGTGKTEFAKMLVKEANKNLYAVGESSEGENLENFRLQSLYRKLKLAAKSKNACLFFDEAEDMFSSMRTRINKVEINRLLEENKSPIIWCTNNIGAMERAFVRRFTLAIHFKTPPLEVRESIWNKYLKGTEITAQTQEISALAKDYNV
ncbi:MAG: ATP-binding protein, partial [Elusimicrobiaceae bacterium]|nr:ATP-binding protein [Elusimicrobiaceae bacterium]